MQPMIPIRYRFARFLRTSLSFPAEEAEEANGLPTERGPETRPRTLSLFCQNERYWKPD